MPTTSFVLISFSAKLEPMNAYERRIIHTKLSDWRDVKTVSEGEGAASAGSQPAFRW